MELLEKHFDTALESPDGIKKLRELILTLAMQGKLVKQDPNDQPASELLKEIQAEKERLIQEGKLKKQKELPPIKPEEIPYRVPEGWAWTRLGEIAELLGGFAFDSKEFKSIGKNQVLRLGNIRPDLIRLDENPVFIDDILAAKTADSRLQTGDIIITMTGTRAKRDYLYSVRVLENPINSITLYFNQRIGVIRLLTASTFLNKALKDEKLKDIIYKTATGSANQANIGMFALTNWVIPLPPLSEQKRIVAKIDELMALCDKLEAQRNARNNKRLTLHTAAINRLLTAKDKNDFDSAWQFITRHFDPLYSIKENVAELKKAILTLAMQGKLVKQDPNDQPASELLKEIQVEKERLIQEGKIKKQKDLAPIKPEEVPYQVPEGWVWTRLGEFSQIIRGITFPSSEKTKEKAQGRIACLRTTNVQSEIEWEDLLFIDRKYMTSEDKIVKQNDIVISMANSRELVGKVAIIKAIPHHEATLGGFLSIIRTNIVLPSFLLFIMKTNYVRTTLIDSASQTTNIANISLEKLNPLLIPLPPLAEQKHIITKINELIAICDKLEKQIDQTSSKQTKLFDAVLAKV